MTDELPVSNDHLYSPYLASLEGMDDAAQQKFFEKFAAQPEPVRLFIASMETYEAVKRLVDSGTVQPRYGVVVAKLVALVAMDEVQATQVPGLLAKVGMDDTQARTAGDAVKAIVAPVIAARSQPVPVPPPAMNEVPPLTTSAPSRTILDLRPPAGAAGKPNP